MSGFPTIETHLTEIVRVASEQGPEVAVRLMVRLFRQYPSTTWDAILPIMGLIILRRIDLYPTQPLTADSLADWIEKMLERFPEDEGSREEEDEDGENLDDEEDDYDDDYDYDYDEEDANEHGNLEGFVVEDDEEEEEKKTTKRHRRT